MDFDLNEKQTYWRDRVRDFIEAKIRPAVPIYKEQDAAGDRWKVIQIVQDLKAEAKAAGICRHHPGIRMSMILWLLKGRASPISNMRCVPRKWAALALHLKSSIAPRPTLAIWKCSCAMALPNKNANG
jgi:hypothetical protein